MTYSAKSIRRVYVAACVLVAASVVAAILLLTDGAGTGGSVARAIGRDWHVTGATCPDGRTMSAGLVLTGGCDR